MKNRTVGVRVAEREERRWRAAAGDGPLADWIRDACRHYAEPEGRWLAGLLERLRVVAPAEWARVLLSIDELAPRDAKMPSELYGRVSSLIGAPPERRAR